MITWLSALMSPYDKQQSFSGQLFPIFSGVLIYMSPGVRDGIVPAGFFIDQDYISGVNIKCSISLFLRFR